MRDEWRPDIEEIFDHYGARITGGRGAWRKATCPLNSHEDMSPSASVNTDTGKWTCFSCDKRGDGLDIVKENEGIVGFADCLRFAKEHFGGSDGSVRGGSVSSPGLSVGSRPGRRKGGAWTPPWGGL